MLNERNVPMLKYGCQLTVASKFNALVLKYTEASASVASTVATPMLW